MKTININNQEITIHSNPQSLDVSNLDQYSGNIYLIFEMGYGNFPCVTIVEAFDETEAMENGEIEEENYQNCIIERIK